jgi:hypothetical protein
VECSYGKYCRIFIVSDRRVTSDWTNLGVIPFAQLKKLNSHSGSWGPNWVHSARRPLLAYYTCPEWLWGWRIWWNEDWQGKPKYSEKTCPSATLFTTNPTLLDPVSNTNCHGGNPATNRLSYGAAFYATNILHWASGLRGLEVTFPPHDPNDTGSNPAEKFGEQSSGRDFKLFDPCSIFTARKRTSSSKGASEQNYRLFPVQAELPIPPADGGVGHGTNCLRQKGAS